MLRWWLGNNSNQTYKGDVSMLYFDKDIKLKMIDNTLSIGVFDENTYIVADIFSNELYCDVQTADEILDNYGVEVDQIDFN